ncbi:MAG TPA: calcium/sodium antiporter, partial [Thermoplasmatales archaeon]|nr:calcium/sodium antiporter [Thermoplasmatales archaeon]
MIPGELVVNVFLFIISIVFLYKGSDILVEGTSKTALRLGVSSLIISLTIVAYGTSAPEFAASSLASYQSHSSLSLGNIIGSCLANLLLVLGISSFIRPISVNLGIIRRELPILISATVLLLLFSLTRNLGKSAGVIFLIAFILYIVFFIQAARKERIEVSFIEKNDGKLSRYILFIITGLVLVIVGAHFLVDSAVYFATLFGVPEFLIAISMVAIGTSLPELAVSATASIKGEADISLGNLLGSNVFNILLILGVCSLINPIFIDLKSLLSEIFLLAITV